MQWRVEGADRKTGEDRVVVVDGFNRRDAEEQAALMGVLASDAREMSDPTLEALHNASRSVRPSPKSPQTIPSYPFLNMASGVLTGLGLVAIFLGLCAVVLAGTVLIARNERELAATLFGGGLVIIMYGVMTAAIGQALSALRDMAINSFYVRARLDSLTR